MSIKGDTAALREEVRTTKRDLTHDFGRLAKYTESKFDSIDDRLMATSKDIKTLFARLRAVEGNPSRSPMTLDFELQKQNKLANNITIANVPAQDGENLFYILSEIVKFLGCEGLTVDELLDAKRVRHLIIFKLRDEARKL